MKILVVIPDWNLGGVTTSASNFCVECVARGYDVDLIVMDNTPTNIVGVNQLYLKGFSKYWNLGASELRKGGIINIVKLIPLALIKKLLNKSGYWVPLVFNSKIHISYDVVLAYRQCAPCYYFALHCVDAKKHLALLHGNLQFMGDVSSWDRMMGRFDKVACVSKAISLDFKKHYPDIADKFCTIYNMFDVDGIKRMATAACPYELNKQFTNIVTLTRHENNHKRVNRIIEICSRLKEMGISQFHWYIAGDGPDYESNRKLAAKLNVCKQITFCGALSNPYPLLKACDFSVLTSATEAYSMAVIESQILCKPIVVMHYPGVEEAVKHQETGIICSQKIDDICEVLRQLISDKNLVMTMQENLERKHASNDIPFEQFLSTLK